MSSHSRVWSKTPAKNGYNFLCFPSVIEHLSLLISHAFKALGIGNQIELTVIDFVRLQSELREIYCWKSRGHVPHSWLMVTMIEQTALTV